MRGTREEAAGAPAAEAGGAVVAAPQAGTERIGEGVATPYGAPAAAAAPRVPLLQLRPAAHNLLEEVIGAMRAKEAATLAAVETHGALHRKHRAQLVGWVADVCEDFRLGLTTASLAVLYMDRVLSRVNVAKNSLQLVAMCCILIAAKYEELDQKVPKLSKLKETAPHLYSIEHICKMETALLCEMQWDLSFVTAAHFLEVFLSLSGGGTDKSDTVHGGAWMPETVSFVHKYAGFFHTLGLEDWDLTVETAPSRFAAAVLTAARCQLHIEPAWPESLENLTGYGAPELGPCVERIAALFREKYPAAAPPAGAKPLEAQGAHLVTTPKGVLDAWAP